MREACGLIIISGLLTGLLLSGNPLMVEAQNVQVNSGDDDAEERGTGAFSSVGVSIGMYSHTDNTSTNYRCENTSLSKLPR